MLELKEFLEEYAIGYSLKNDYEVKIDIIHERHLHMMIHKFPCSIFKDEVGFSILGSGGEQKFETEEQVREELKRFFTEN